MIHIGIVGSRAIDHNDEYNVEKVYDFLDMIFENCNPELVCIHSGGASGVDVIAIWYAIEKGFSYKEHLPDFLTYPYGQHHNRAYFERNQTIVNETDCLVAITRGESRGTEYTVDYAKNVRKWVIETEFPEDHRVLYDTNFVPHWINNFLLPRCKK